MSEIIVPNTLITRILTIFNAENLSIANYKCSTQRSHIKNLITEKITIYAIRVYASPRYIILEDGTKIEAHHEKTEVVKLQSESQLLVSPVGKIATTVYRIHEAGYGEKINYDIDDSKLIHDMENLNYQLIAAMQSGQYQTKEA